MRRNTPRPLTWVGGRKGERRAGWQGGAAWRRACSWGSFPGGVLRQLEVQVLCARTESGQSSRGSCLCRGLRVPLPREGEQQRRERQEEDTAWPFTTSGTSGGGSGHLRHTGCAAVLMDERDLRAWGSVRQEAPRCSAREVHHQRGGFADVRTRVWGAGGSETDQGRGQGEVRKWRKEGASWGQMLLPGEMSG